MAKLPPPPPLAMPVPGVTRNQIKQAVGDLLMASAARIGRELNFIGPGAIGLIYHALEDMTAAGELEKTWINNQFLFSVRNEP
ncbi:MAG: hypothetical protein NTY36_01470 [Deltaproteobacteria bacterium]|nr:hypothetical protein [Deltaproteobacteria bacterium]